MKGRGGAYEAIPVVIKCRTVSCCKKRKYSLYVFNLNEWEVIRNNKNRCVEK
jgi:hypothetical protein